MQRLHTAILLVALSLVGCGSSDTPTPDSTVFHSGVVLTMDAGFSVADAFAIADDKIVAVGTYADVQAAVGTNAQQVDLAGAVVMPAFVDAHVHTISAAKFEIFDDVGLTQFASVEDALGYMIEQGAEAKPGDWLLFENIDFGTQTSSTDLLTADMLDQVSTDNPVFVFHAGGHISSVNSYMLEVMGVDANTPEPEAGGSIGRNEDGSPNGVLYGYASILALNVLDPFNNYDIQSGMGRMSTRWLSRGIGTVGDAGVGASGSTDELNLLQQLAADDIMQFRVRGYLSNSLTQKWLDLGVEAGFGDADVRVVGYKLSADGSNQARTGLQREPYKGTESVGIAYLTEQQIYDEVMSFAAMGYQLAIHGNGDAGIDNIISAVTRAKADGADLRRVRIEHCSLVQDDQLEKLKALDISCSFLIGHVRLWGAAFKNSVFDLEKAEKLDRTGSFEREGIPYSLHTDNAVTDFSPLEMVEIAVTRELFAEPGTVLAPEERASIEMALRGVTSVPAWQLMSEHEIGSIEAGKLADFVVLAEDPRTVEPSQIGEIQVVETWIDGVRRYQAEQDESVISDVWHKAKLRGVAFRAIGQEPGWLLEITNGSEILLETDYGQQRSSMPYVEPIVFQEERRSQFVLEEFDTLIEIRGERCTDSMSGEEFESSVTVVIADETLQGCGRAFF